MPTLNPNPFPLPNLYHICFPRELHSENTDHTLDSMYPHLQVKK